MQIDIVSIFPEMFPNVLGTSILKRAQEKGHLQIAIHNLRDYTHDSHRSVDDRPYGGGPGMIMKIEPIDEAMASIKSSRSCPRHENGLIGACRTLLMCPTGERYSTKIAQTLSLCSHLIIICGHYEGVDERVKDLLVDESISIGDFVLTGGELPAMAVIDGLARYIPGVIGHEQATEEESFASGWLEYPQYTRPPVFRGAPVPRVLLSGDHDQIAQWRKEQSIERTTATRPDLMKGNHLRTKQ